MPIAKMFEFCNIKAKEIELYVKRRYCQEQFKVMREKKKKERNINPDRNALADIKHTKYQQPNDRGDKDGKYWYANLIR